MTRTGRAMNRTATFFESVAGLFLAATVMLTVLDVCLRTIDEEWRIFGVIEMVQLTFDSLVFLAVPAVFLVGQNIMVNLFDEVLSRPFMRFLVISSAIATVAFLAILLSQVIVTGLEAVSFGDTTQDLQWPLVWYWIPIWIGVGVGLVAELVHLALLVGDGAETGADDRPQAGFE